MGKQKFCSHLVFALVLLVSCFSFDSAYAGIDDFPKVQTGKLDTFGYASRQVVELIDDDGCKVIDESEVVQVRASRTITKIDSARRKKVVYSYDANNRLVDREVFQYDSLKHLINHELYDARYPKIKENVVYEGGECKYREEFVYKENGILLEHHMFYYDSRRELARTYDEKGRVLLETETNYNHKGQILDRTTICEKKKILETFSYNENFQLTDYYTYDETGKVLDHEVTTYTANGWELKDKKGRLISSYVKDGSCCHSCEYKDGRLYKEIISCDDSYSGKYSEIYYDKNGVVRGSIIIMAVD